MSRVHECKYRTCHNLVPINQQYCQLHKQYEKDTRYQEHKTYNKFYRDEHANSFYQSKQWKQTRNYVINRDHYQCQVCGNVINNRKIIDHIIPLKIDNAKALNTNNLWTLCQRCHTIKTNIEYNILNSNNGVNKLKHLSIDWWKRVIKERINKQ